MGNKRRAKGKSPSCIELEKAITKYAAIRNKLRELGKGLEGKKLFSGNDNIIGDIGEYWVIKYFRERKKLKPELAEDKVSRFDFKMDDPEGNRKRVRVSVKTMTYWSNTKQGSPVTGVSPQEWEYFAAIYLNKYLEPEKLAVVKRKEFVKYQKESQNFRWWKWLGNFEIRYHQT